MGKSSTHPNFDIQWMWVISFTPRLLYPKDMMLSGERTRSEYLEKKFSLPTLGFTIRLPRNTRK